MSPTIAVPSTASASVPPAIRVDRPPPLARLRLVSLRLANSAADFCARVDGVRVWSELVGDGASATGRSRYRALPGASTWATVPAVVSALEDFLTQFKQTADVIMDSWFVCDNERT